eukprot:gene4512-14673_t
MAFVHQQLLPVGSPLLSDELRQQATVIAAHMRETHSKLIIDEERVFEYARFLLLKTYMEDGSLPPALAPSGIVDEVWQAHMLRPHLYMRLCEELGMGVIAHDPDTALDIDNHNKRLAKTTKLYAVMFGGEAGHMWHENAGHAAALLPAVKLEAGNATPVKTAQTEMNIETLFGQKPESVMGASASFGYKLWQQATTITAHMRDTHSKLSSEEERVFEYARFLLLKTYMEDGSLPPVLAPSGILDEVRGRECGFKREKL